MRTNVPHPLASGLRFELYASEQVKTSSGIQRVKQWDILDLASVSTLRKWTTRLKLTARGRSRLRRHFRASERSDSGDKYFAQESAAESGR